jgi:predicted nicotinamide N-methyase
MLRGDVEWAEVGEGVLTLPLLGAVRFDREADSLERTDKCMWPCALLLCEWLLSAPSTLFPSDATVVELGCGVGLASRCAYVALGDVARVVATDRVLNESLRANLEDLDVELIALDWSDASAAVALVEQAKANVVVVGSDLIYDNDVTTALVAMLEAVFEQTSCPLEVVLRQSSASSGRRATRSSLRRFTTSSSI